MRANRIDIKICFTVILFLFVTIAYSQDNKGKGVIKSKETPRVESQLPSGFRWKLVWNDEFDGFDLDTSKWDYRLYIMHSRHKTWTDDAAELDGKGNLLLRIYEKDGDYYSSQLQTGSNYMDVPGNQYGNSKLSWPIGKIESAKFLHKYGYYEIRCKLQTQPGWWAAFWLQSPTIGSTLDPLDSGVEMDIMENFTRDGIISHNIHWNGYGKDHKGEGSGPISIRETNDDFHTYGLHWSPTGYAFYVDGKETWRISGPVSHREQFILVSTECMGYREGSPSPILKNIKLPDYFVVDYVRVYDEIK
jgi:beta-glucanase (GH16 family)